MIVTWRNNSVRKIWNKTIVLCAVIKYFCGYLFYSYWGCSYIKMFDPKSNTLLQKWQLYSYYSAFGNCKGQCFSHFQSPFLILLLFYKGLEDNKLTDFNKRRLISLLCAFTVDDNLEQDLKPWIWGSSLGNICSLCLVIHQTKDFQKSCASPLSYCFCAGRSSCLLPLCLEEAVAFASNSLCVKLIFYLLLFHLHSQLVLMPQENQESMWGVSC